MGAKKLKTEYEPWSAAEFDTYREAEKTPWYYFMEIGEWLGAFIVLALISIFLFYY